MSIDTTLLHESINRALAIAAEINAASERLVYNLEAYGPYSLSQHVECHRDTEHGPICVECGSTGFEFISGTPGRDFGYPEDCYEATDDECSCMSCGADADDTSYQSMLDSLREQFEY